MKRKELIEVLKRTKERFGAGYPVILDAEGKVIDGRHRLKADANWPKVRLEGVSGVQSTILRLILNVARRGVSDKEKTEMLAEIARETGWTPKQIAEEIGMSYQWVMKYLPDEYKVRPGAGPRRVLRRGTQPEVKVEKSLAEEVLAEAVEESVSVEEVEEVAKARKPPKPREDVLVKMGEMYGYRLLDICEYIYRGSSQLGLARWMKAVKRTIGLLLDFLEDRGLMDEFKEWARVRA